MNHGESIVTAQYVEAIVIVKVGSRAEANDWFNEKGFDVIPMRSGLLISGSGALFASVFGIESNATHPGAVDIELVVPSDLHDIVDSIVIRRTPSIHGN